MENVSITEVGLYDRYIHRKSKVLIERNYSVRIKHRYCLKKQPRLANFLDEYQIPYEVCDLPEIKYNTYTFDLYENQAVYRKFKIQFPFVSRYDSIKLIEYSKEEIENAEWLIVRSKNKKLSGNMMKMRLNNHVLIKDYL